MLGSNKGVQEQRPRVSFLLFPDLQGLMMTVITLMMLMTVIMLMGKVVKTAKMKNLIFEMCPFKLSFLPFIFSLFSIGNNR